jgi:hypothetical protein
MVYDENEEGFYEKTAHQSFFNDYVYHAGTGLYESVK